MSLDRTPLHRLPRKQTTYLPHLPVDVSYLWDGIFHQTTVKSTKKHPYYLSWGSLYVLYLCHRIWHRAHPEKETLLPMGLQQGKAQYKGHHPIGLCPSVVYRWFDL